MPAPEPTSQSIKQIEKELNSNYVTYSELTKQVELAKQAVAKTPTRPIQSSSIVAAAAAAASHSKHAAYQSKQIHVFITGLNTCPIYCHVCQKLIPLIAYASKCQLCSFTCHSTCSSLNKSRKSIKSSTFDPLKYCNASNYLIISLEYNNYLNKLINLNNQVTSTSNRLHGTVLLNDYVFVDNNSKWKKLWISLRIDDKQQEARLDIYQKKSNLKPIDTINLITDRIMIETNTKQINKIKAVNSPSVNASTNPAVAAAVDDQANIYEELNEDIDSLINFEKSSLIILLYSNNTGSSFSGGSSGNKIMLKLGFASFSKKNLWYDVLLSSVLIGRKSTSTLILNKKLASTAINTACEQFKLMNVSRVLKPFLELCDTIVNSYCFINDNLIALACDDGLYALNSYQQKTTAGGAEAETANNISLVKIDKVESAHKLYYENEFGKLCFIGRKSRQFLSIDVNELNTCLINNDYQINSNRAVDESENDFENDEDDEAKSISVSLEHIHNIDRCHLFECRFNKSNGHWHLAVATPETIFVLLYNKITQKYSLVKTVQTQSDSPCLCIKFTNNFGINQLIYACGKEFFKMDVTYLQATPITIDHSQLQLSQLQMQQQPNAVCVITPQTYQQQEAILLCYDNYGVFFVYNFTTMQWQTPNIVKKSSSSSINTPSCDSSSNLLQSSSVLKWPRGNGLTPLQIEYDSSYLYLFYNDSIVVYTVAFESDLSLSVRKLGITFVYKPRYLNTLNNKNSNCIIISNRRILNEEQLEQEMNEIENNKALNNDSQEDEYLLDEYALDEDGRYSANKVNDTLINDLNDKICLSYFTPNSN